MGHKFQSDLRVDKNVAISSGVYSLASSGRKAEQTIAYSSSNELFFGCGVLAPDKILVFYWVFKIPLRFLLAELSNVSLWLTED